MPDGEDGFIWQDFIRARKRVIHWMRDELQYSEERIIMELSMDSRQVALVLDSIKVRSENV